ncbi:hypothetical protein PAAL109150_09560 [Paenibacillus alkaliterrae]
MFLKPFGGRSSELSLVSRSKFAEWASLAGLDLFPRLILDSAVHLTPFGGRSDELSLVSRSKFAEWASLVVLDLFLSLMVESVA